MKIIKSKKGAITLFVLIAGLFFITFLTTMFMLGSVKRQASLEATKQTGEIYSSGDANEIYQNYVGSNVVPIYTFEQLKKMCSGDTIAINEENGKYYTFSTNAIYVLRNNIIGEHNGIMTIPPEPTEFDGGKLEGNGKTIEIKDTSKQNVEIYYYYNNSNNYAFPITKEGYSYNGLMLFCDAVNNSGDGHSFSTTTWKDLSGNNNDIELYDGPTWKSDSLFFDGINDYGSVDYATNFTPALTIQTAYALESEIAAFVWNFANGTSSEYRFAGGYRDGIFYVRNNNGTTKQQGYGQNCINKNISETAIMLPSQNKADVYIDGQKKSSIVNIDLSNISADKLFIGKWNNSKLMDLYNVRVYSRELTQEEITHNNNVDKARYNFDRIVTTPTPTPTPTPIPTPTPRPLPTGWSHTAVADIITETSEVEGVTKERKAPIPTGFKASIYEGETTIADGLVIYETNTNLTADTGSSTTNHDNAMTTYNQYVWIPVDNINDMVMCESRTASSECNIDFVDGVLKCTNSAHSSTATDLCGRLYGGGSSFGIQSPTNYKYDSDWREPAVVTGKSSAASLADYLTGTIYDGGNTSILKEDGITNVTGASNILAELKRQFNAMAKSVAIYGGFYVGRYEAGYVNNVAISRKGTIVDNILTPQPANASYPARVENWYGLYNKLIKAKTGTVSQMIWGCQWDQVMKFVDGKTDGNGDIYDVTVENYTRHTGDKDATGTNINDLVQNIYDLEGNFWEWTSTAGYTHGRAYRGGFCEESGDTASELRNVSPTVMDNFVSARPGLYVSL